MINVDAAKEALRLIGLLKVALAFDAENKERKEVRAMNERAISDIVADARVSMCTSLSRLCLRGTTTTSAAAYGASRPSGGYSLPG